MSYCDVHCLLQSEDAKPTPGFTQVLELARQGKAHLTATVASPLVAMPYTPFGGEWSGGFVTEFNERSQALAEETTNNLRQAAQIAGVTHEIAVKSDFLGAIARDAAISARCADFIVLDQPQDMLESREALMEAILFRSGRPVFLASPHKIVSDIRRLLIAWDGSAHAARAASDALSLFREQIKTVEIVAVSGEKNLSRSLPGADYAHHVARMGIEAVLSTLPTERSSVAATLDHHAVATGADLIVMGGFGHSRLREFIMGGVTRELTGMAHVPLLLAY